MTATFTSVRCAIPRCATWTGTSGAGYRAVSPQRLLDTQPGTRVLILTSSSNERNVQEADQRNLAQWQQMVLVAQDDTAAL